MSREEVAKEIIEIMAEQGIINDTINVDLNASLVNEIGVNSVRIVRLIVALEERFDFEFDDEQLGITTYENIHSIIDTVAGHLEKSDIIL